MPDAFAIIPEDAQQQMRGLEARIDEALARLSRDGDGERLGVHLRLDSRSPKDGVFLIPKLTQLLKKIILSKFFDQPWSRECQQHDIVSFHRCIIKAQEVRSGRDALELLRHSQRIEADSVLGQTANSGDASSQLVLRRWDSRVDPLHEVRAFVCRGRVTAISQYIESIVVPALLTHAKQIQGLVCEAAAQVDDRIRHLVPNDPYAGAPFYAADFVLIPHDENSHGFKHALLIEINPPPPVAGAVLFDWNKDHDRAILTGQSTDSTCVRLVEKHMPWANINFHPPTKEYVDRLRGRHRSEFYVWLSRCCRHRHHKHTD